ncbi:hypothetical protein HDV05_002791 [Chytridiales sp. JEL 0842]|nr:hypothetical protein HDV05_002791 [Chytridiales sp. JEL 0842]
MQPPQQQSPTQHLPSFNNHHFHEHSQHQEDHQHLVHEHAPYPNHLLHIEPPRLDPHPARHQVHQHTHGYNNNHHQHLQLPSYTQLNNNLNDNSLIQPMSGDTRMTELSPHPPHTHHTPTHPYTHPHTHPHTHTASSSLTPSTIPTNSSPPPVPPTTTAASTSLVTSLGPTIGLTTPKLSDSTPTILKSLGKHQKPLAHESFFGYIDTPIDALRLFTAAKVEVDQGDDHYTKQKTPNQNVGGNSDEDGGKKRVVGIPRIKSRLTNSQRKSIRSGSVFVFNGQESGIKRWTDGLQWSPSRVQSGCFLIYRQIERASASAESATSATATNAPQDPDEDLFEPGLAKLKNSMVVVPQGLVKKTFSMNFQGTDLHIISYYKKSDVLSGLLPIPSKVEPWGGLQISEEMIQHLLKNPLSKSLNASFPSTLPSSSSNSSSPKLQPTPAAGPKPVAWIDLEKAQEKTRPTVLGSTPAAFQQKRKSSVSHSSTPVSNFLAVAAPSNVVKHSASATGVPFSGGPSGLSSLVHMEPKPNFSGSRPALLQPGIVASHPQLHYHQMMPEAGRSYPRRDSTGGLIMSTTTHGGVSKGGVHRRRASLMSFGGGVAGDWTGFEQRTGGGKAAMGAGSLGSLAGLERLDETVRALPTSGRSLDSWSTSRAQEAHAALPKLSKTVAHLLRTSTSSSRVAGAHVELVIECGGLGEVVCRELKETSAGAGSINGLKRKVVLWDPNKLENVKIDTPSASFVPTLTQQQVTSSWFSWPTSLFGGGSGEVEYVKENVGEGVVVVTVGKCGLEKAVRERQKQ